MPVLSITMRMQLFHKKSSFCSKTVDNLGKTVDNLTHMWITSNVYSINARSDSRPHPHIWGVHMFQTQINPKLESCPKRVSEWD